ncbi:MAG TPA: hypothetical protein VF852_00025 [Pseudolabrys sp.]
MPTELHSFRRLVLGLQSSAPDPAMRLAVELAELLDLDLLGLFLEDASLRDLAGIPFAREFRLLGGGWHSLDLDRLVHDMEVAARGMERTFTQAVGSLSKRSQFEVMRGPVAEAITSISNTGDIVMIVEPTSAAERVSGQFSWLVKAAFRSAAAVMLVPSRIIRFKGPIVAVAMAGDDPTIAAAAAIAVAAKEKLIVIGPGGRDRENPRTAQLAAETGLTIQYVTAGDLSADSTACLKAMRQLQERLVVMARLPFDGATASAIVTARQVPVLVIEPERLPPGEGDSRT